MHIIRVKLQYGHFQKLLSRWQVIAQRRGIDCHTLLSAFLLSLMDTHWIFILSDCYIELRLQNVFQHLRLPFPKYRVALGGCVEKVGTSFGCKMLVSR